MLFISSSVSVIWVSSHIVIEAWDIEAIDYGSLLATCRIASWNGCPLRESLIDMSCVSGTIGVVRISSIVSVKAWGINAISNRGSLASSRVTSRDRSSLVKSLVNMWLNVSRSVSVISVSSDVGV